MRVRVRAAASRLLCVFLLAGCGGGSSSNEPMAANPSTPPAALPPTTPASAGARGVFASAGATNATVVNHPQARGALIRVSWSAVEPAAGSYDFSAIENQLALLRSAGKRWSLGVLGGPSAPAWLYASPYNVPPLYITFRSQPAQVPQFWRAALQQRLNDLAQALAARYASDANLSLVYVPQMTGNGIEGHFNGNVDSALTSQGFTEDLWVDAVMDATRTFANAFPSTPIAVELHDILSSANVGRRIMDAIEADSALLNQVGVAIWWLSGKTDYQSDLLTALGSFQGEIYAQLIDRADTTTAFPNGDYTAAFNQAKSLGIRYVEPWDVDFTSHRWDALFQDFNAYAAQ